MINRSNLLALRNAIDDVLVDMMPKGTATRQRLNKEDEMLAHIEKNFATGSVKKFEPKTKKKKITTDH